MSTDPVGGAEQTLLDALHHATRAVKSRIQSELHTERLTACQFWTLHHIHEHGSTTTGQLAAMLAVTPASVSVAVEGLVRAGHVRRRPLAQDRRVLRLESTARGDRLVEAVWRRIAASFAEDVRGLPDRDLLTAARVLRQLQGSAHSVPLARAVPREALAA